MGIVTIVFFLILVIYVIYITQLTIGFNKVKTFENNTKNPKTSFAIIIPFRNEEKNLPKLLLSISNLNYPKELFEIIVVDDFSEDNSVRKFSDWRMQNGLIETTLLENLKLSNSPKKDALTRAIPIVKKEWIITTDADCIVPENWLLTIDNFIQDTNYQMIASSVVYKTKNNWFHVFQQLNLLSLQGTTIGSFGIEKPFMCNGANFIYTKKLFQELGGFGKINQVSSGDDVLLLQKAVSKFPEKVTYLKSKNTIVKTKPENDLFKMFMQQVRWSSKTSEYNSFYPKSLAIVVFLVNAILVCGLFLVFYKLMSYKTLLLLFFIKYLIDFIMINKASIFLRNKKTIPLASSLVYPFFATAVGIYSLFGSFTWKGRTFKK